MTEILPEGDAFAVTGLAVIHPWLADAMGHLTTRHYLAIFDDAAWHCFAEIGYQAQVATAQGWGWADVKSETTYLDEVPVGALVVIKSRVQRVGRSSITFEHIMHDREDMKICARLVCTTVCFDLKQRRSRALPAEITIAVSKKFPMAVGGEKVASA